MTYLNRSISVEIGVLLLIGMVAAALLPSVAAASVFECDVVRAYSVVNGELIETKQDRLAKMTWPKVIFDDDTGLAVYGRPGADEWSKAQFTMTSKGSKDMSAEGYRLHNGVLLEAITIKTWVNPIGFVWLGAGLSDVFSGTCSVRAWTR